MAYTPEYLEKNREIINEKRRDKYVSRDRKAEYQMHREAILKRGREDRAQCPLCKLEFRRLYIPRHIETRHKIDKE